MVNNSGPVAPQPLHACQGRGWQATAIWSTLLRHAHAAEENIGVPPGGFPAPAKSPFGGFIQVRRRQVGFVAFIRTSHGILVVFGGDMLKWQGDRQSAGAVANIVRRSAITAKNGARHRALPTDAMKPRKEGR
jgi:hypothetical protein